MILDTSFLIDVLRGEDRVKDWERTLDEQGTAIVTAISVMELWEGIHRSDANDEERERVAALLQGLHHADFDRASASTAGEIAASLADRGREIDVEDVMIGATALEHDDAVLTRNADHVGQIDDLDVETY